MSTRAPNSCCDGESSGHPSHDKVLKRVNRASGQLQGVRNMIEERRYCPDILTQLRAVRSAVKSIEAEVLKTHLESCVAEAFSTNNKKERERKIEELRSMLVRFD